MILAITQRYGKDEKKGSFSENFSIGKYYKDIFESLGILLFPVSSLTEIDKVVDLCDGLIVTGRCIDINPKYYGEQCMKETNISNDYDKDDELDFTLIKLFYNKNKPILGICAGIQSLNVCFGGTLYQDIPNHSIKNGVKKHFINIEKESCLYKCYKESKIEVNSFHHQAIKEPAKEFKVIATSEDGIIEAIEYKNILGVQWHPEYSMDFKFFEFFINFFCNSN